MQVSATRCGTPVAMSERILREPCGSKLTRRNIGKRAFFGRTAAGDTRTEFRVTSAEIHRHKSPIIAPSAATTDLQDLLIAAGKRDSAAFARLYEATKGKLFGLALRILRRQDMAEEVLQESFVSIWNHAQEYAPDKSAPMTWMATIVRNRCLDIVRRPNYQAQDLDESVLENIEDEATGPLDNLLANLDAAALAECMRRLESAQRQSIMLAFFRGLTHAELAEHLAEPLGTIKTRIRRGLMSLKNCLSQ